MNRLASETSPYLRQHADNPVDWYPWGDEAFARARRQDRPVFLSVGYSACHWCHVMAHESFEDEDTARLLNEAFVSVKVDREERPDVDAVYMEAVQAVTGRGGWPMTVFLTPDGRPFFGGTYFPRDDHPGTPGFRRLLAAIEEAWRERRSEIEQQADALAAAVARRTTVPAPQAMPARSSPATAALLEGAVRQLAERFDPTWGGFGHEPKFPQPGLLELCLRHHRLTGEARSLDMAGRTLGAMAAGGIYDHLGGGFCRYSTDATWTIPHFEKMLYDQAGLVRAYLHAWQATGEPLWLQVVDETIGYVLRDLRGERGGLCSAEDADSEGEEGRFYLWTPAQLEEVLGPLAGRAAHWYGVEEGPNFEGRSILRRPPDAPLLRPDDVEQARRELLAARARRVRPGLDDKVLTEWNAMFGSALAEAAAATGNAGWREAAVELARFLLGQLRRADGRWLRSWQGGRARHLAYAADYAWVVDFLTRVSELTGEPSWLDDALSTAGAMMDLFADDGGPLWTTGADAETLVVRPVELLDGATPSATAVAGTALVRLGALRGDQLLQRRGTELLAVAASLAEDHPLAVAHGLAGIETAHDLTEVVVTGERPDLLEIVRHRYEPHAVVAWGTPSASPLWEGRRDGLAYVCRDATCQEPAGTPQELAARLDAELAAERARATVSATR